MKHDIQHSLTFTSLLSSQHRRPTHDVCRLLADLDNTLLNFSDSTKEGFFQLVYRASHAINDDAILHMMHKTAELEATNKSLQMLIQSLSALDD